MVGRQSLVMSDRKSLKTVHLIVEGRVQAVGFRFFTQQTAAQLAINGWVRNRSDGSVEVKAEGPQDSIDQFITLLKKGNRFAKVRSISVYIADYPEHFSSFDILSSIE